jgi:hypothetical protein
MYVWTELFFFLQVLLPRNKLGAYTLERWGKLEKHSTFLLSTLEHTFIQYAVKPKSKGKLSNISRWRTLFKGTDSQDFLIGFLGCENQIITF